MLINAQVVPNSSRSAVGASCLCPRQARVAAQSLSVCYAPHISLRCMSLHRRRLPSDVQQSVRSLSTAQLHHRWQGRLWLRCHSAATAARAYAAPDTVARLYALLNQRSIAAINSCFSPDVVYENLAIQDSLTGLQAVARFYQDSLATVPDEAVFELQQATAGDSSGRAAVVWRLVLPSSQTVMGRGISFYTLNPDGLISSVTECQEHPVKMSHSQLLLVRPLVTPLVRSLAEPMLPAVQGVSRTLQQGVDALLEPLANMTSMVASQNPTTGFVEQTSGTGGSNSSSSNSVGSGQPAAGFPATFQPANPNVETTAAVNASGALRPSAAAPQQFPNTPAGQRAAARVAAARTAQLAAAGTTDAISGRATGAPAAAAATARPAAAGAGARSRPPGVAAASVTGGASGSASVAGTVNFSGVWVKDAARSDTAGYEASLDVLGLSGLQKVTARLIEGVEIQQTSTTFTVSFLTVVPFFKVTEAVPLNGGSTQLGRRDLRPGKQTTAAREVPEGLLVEMSWGAPLAGRLTELYSMLPDGSMTVTAETRVGTNYAKSVSVYTRSKGSRDALLADSRRRNGSLAAAIQRQQDQGLST